MAKSAAQERFPSPRRRRPFVAAPSRSLSRERHTIESRRHGRPLTSHGNAARLTASPPFRERPPTPAGQTRTTAAPPKRLAAAIVSTTKRASTSRCATKKGASVCCGASAWSAGTFKNAWTTPTKTLR